MAGSVLVQPKSSEVRCARRVPRTLPKLASSGMALLSRWELRARVKARMSDGVGVERKRPAADEDAAVNDEASCMSLVADSACEPALEAVPESVPVAAPLDSGVLATAAEIEDHASVSSETTADSEKENAPLLRLRVGDTVLVKVDDDDDDGDCDSCESEPSDCEGEEESEGSRSRRRRALWAHVEQGGAALLPFPPRDDEEDDDEDDEMEEEDAVPHAGAQADAFFADAAPRRSACAAAGAGVAATVRGQPAGQPLGGLAAGCGDRFRRDAGQRRPNLPARGPHGGAVRLGRHAAIVDVAVRARPPGGRLYRVAAGAGERVARAGGAGGAGAARGRPSWHRACGDQRRDRLGAAVRTALHPGRVETHGAAWHHGAGAASERAPRPQPGGARRLCQRARSRPHHRTHLAALQQDQDGQVRRTSRPGTTAPPTAAGASLVCPPVHV
eukprot:ctg_979.g328